MDEGLAGLAAGYEFMPEPAVALGRAVQGDEVNTGFEVAVPLAMLNRHGLVAGATQAGKTKTVQGLAGRLSDVGVPTVADMKGDVSGPSRARPARRSPPASRSSRPLGPAPLTGRAPHPVRRPGQGGAGTGTSVSELGAPLLSKILDLNDVQTSVLSLVFHYADSGGLLLVDLKDLREVLRFLGTDEARRPWPSWVGWQADPRGAAAQAGRARGARSGRAVRRGRLRCQRPAAHRRLERVW